MLPKKLYVGVNELLTVAGYKTYLLEQTPSNDVISNLEGFICFDIEDSENSHHSEGLAYTVNNGLPYHFNLVIYVYAKTVAIRSNIQELIVNKLQPKVSNKRTNLVSYQLPTTTDVFVRHVRHLATTQLGVQKTGQSVTELVGTVLNYFCSFSIVED